MNKKLKIGILVIGVIAIATAVMIIASSYRNLPNKVEIAEAIIKNGSGETLKIERTTAQDIVDILRKKMKSGDRMKMRFKNSITFLDANGKSLLELYFADPALYDIRCSVLVDKKPYDVPEEFAQKIREISNEKKFSLYQE